MEIKIAYDDSKQEFYVWLYVDTIPLYSFVTGNLQDTYHMIRQMVGLGMYISDYELTKLDSLAVKTYSSKAYQELFKQ